MLSAERRRNSMFELRTIVNDVCNISFSGMYATKCEAIDTLNSFKSTFQIVDGREYEYIVESLTDDVTVYTLNINRPVTGEIAVYTFYLIDRTEKDNNDMEVTL